jgi:SAM-dependent methyltransferase
MICISHIDDFLLHHLPNKYIGKLGIWIEDFNMQIEAMLSNNFNSIKGPLFKTETNLTTTKWNKKYYEPCNDNIIEFIPSYCKSILSVGCGRGATEGKLVQDGKRVVAIPLDAVIAACAESRGIEITTPSFEEALGELHNRQFGCLLFINVLEYLERPIEVFSKFLKFLRPGGMVCVVVHNLDHVSVIKQKLARKPMYKDIKNIGDFDLTGLQRLNKRRICGAFKHYGLKYITMTTVPSERFGVFSKVTLGIFNRWISPYLYFTAYKGLRSDDEPANN